MLISKLMMKLMCQSCIIDIILYEDYSNSFTLFHFSQPKYLFPEVDHHHQLNCRLHINVQNQRRDCPFRVILRTLTREEHLFLSHMLVIRLHCCYRWMHFTISSLHCLSGLFYWCWWLQNSFRQHTVNCGLKIADNMRHILISSHMYSLIKCRLQLLQC